MAKKPRPSLAELDEKIKKGQKELSDFEARQTARKAEGPKLDKPANSNVKAPKPTKSGRANAPHDARKIWNDTIRRGKSAAGTATNTAGKAGTAAAETASSRAASWGLEGLKMAGRVGGVYVDMIANAKPTNSGEREWLATRDRVTAMRRKTPETKGIIYGATPKLPDKTGGKSTAQKPRKQIYDRVPGSAPEAPRDDRASSGFTPSAATGPNKFESSANNPLNQARAARDQVQKAFSKMQSNSTGAAPAGSTSDSGYSKGSSKDANVGTSQMSGETKQRGSVRTLQTRYQRDSGLAMDTRKRK